MVTTSLVEQKTTSAFASMTPVRLGEDAPLQGRIRLSPGGLTPDVAPQLAEHLLTGQAKGAVMSTPPEGEKATFATTAGLELRPRERAPEADLHMELEPRMSSSAVLRWSATVTGAAAVVLAGVALPCRVDA